MGVRTLRLRRPAWSQGQPVERLLNSAWLIAGWLPDVLAHGPFDTIVIGTDPAFAPLLALPLKRLSRARLVHWAFDLFPEAIAADSPRLAGSLAYRLAEGAMGNAYRAFDTIVDIGPCMRERIARYAPAADFRTIVPWPLVDPDAGTAVDPATRAELFGDAHLGILYSGTLGKAHEFESLLALARASRERFGRRVAFCFAGRGARFEDLQSALTTNDTNVRIAPFCDEAELERRLQAADVHVVSLREGWEGIVVPSKYFASLAMRKPVLVSGSPTSSPAVWTKRHDCGLVLEGQNGIAWIESLLADRSELNRLGANARSAYEQHFSKEASLDAWCKLIAER